MRDDCEENDISMTIVLVIIAIALTVEATMLTLEFMGSDKVECTVLWCTFTTERSTYSRECYLNGERVDCPRFDKMDCWQNKTWVCE